MINYISAIIKAMPDDFEPSFPDESETVKIITDTICAYYHLQPGDLTSKTGNEDVSKAKHIYRYLLHEKGFGVRRIGRIANVSHVTASGSLKLIKDYISIGDPFCEDLTALKRLLRA